MRVVIAEDSVFLREGPSRLLADEEIEVVEGVGDGDALLVAVERHRPDLAIVRPHASHPHRRGPARTDEARRRVPATAILVLSQYVEERYASDLLAAGGVGVGYLLKERVADVGEFVESVRRVAAGGTAFDPEVIAQLMGRRRQDDPLSELTPREREVLTLMPEGLSNIAIAKKLWLKVGAVEKHISSIFARLGLYPGEDENRRVRAVLTYLEGVRGR